VFAKHTMLTEFQLADAMPIEKSSLTRHGQASSLVYPRRICQRLVASEVDNELEISAASPVIVVPQRRYKSANFKSPLITIREPFDTFKAPSH
jgi:hypothetical protein